MVLQAFDAGLARICWLCHGEHMLLLFVNGLNATPRYMAAVGHGMLQDC